MVQEWEALTAWVAENAERLTGCPGPHVFIALDPERRPARRFGCERCRGEVDASHAFWYAQGLEHGRSFAIRSTLPTIRELVGTEQALTSRPGDAG